MNLNTQAEQKHGTEQAHRWKRHQMWIETETLNGSGEEYDSDQNMDCICQSDDQADIDRAWDACTRVTQEQYFLIITPLDVEIEHKGPFYDFDSVLDAAKAHRQNDPGDFKDGLYWMKLHYGKPAFSFFTGADLDGADDDQPTQTDDAKGEGGAA